MSWELFVKAVDQHPSPVIHLYFGGEPLCHPRIADFVAYAKKKTATTLYTNGLLLTPILAQQFCEAGLDVLGISLDAVDPLLYREKRVGGCLDVLLANMRMFKEIRGSAKRPILVVDLIRFPDEQDQMNMARTLLKDLADEIHAKAYFHYPLLSAEPNLVQPPCAQPEASLAILWDGRVTVCCLDFGAVGVVGDLNKQSMTEVLSSSARNLIRQACAGGQQGLLAMCRTCRSAEAMNQPYLQ